MIQFLEINIMHWEHFSEKGVFKKILTNPSTNAILISVI